MIYGNFAKRDRLKKILSEINSGSLILFGPEGVGKKSHLLDLVNKLNLKYVLLSSKKTYSINLARSLKAISMKNYRGKNLFIIDDAHKLTKPAQNALLKSLEEPADNIIFVLITHRIGNILSTIKSRSLLIPFTTLSSTDTQKALLENKINLKKIRILLEFYSGQPGKIINLARKKQINKLIQYLITPEKEKKLLLLEDISEDFKLEEVLELQLMFWRKELLQFTPTKRKISFCYETLRLLFESEKNYLSLNQKLQLTYLIFSS